MSPENNLIVDDPPIPILPELLFENPICVSGVLLRRVVGDCRSSMSRVLARLGFMIRMAYAGCRVPAENIVIAYRLPGPDDAIRKNANNSLFWINSSVNQNYLRT
jgi:hypothetical protein